MEILMVGAEAVEAECVQTITQKLGHKVETVKRGNDALLIDKSRNFDLILLDLFLPDMKGYELIPEIKKVWPQSKIIVITESNSRELERNVRKEGVIYYMIKPIDTKYMESIIKHISNKVK